MIGFRANCILKQTVAKFQQFSKIDYNETFIFRVAFRLRSRLRYAYASVRADS